MNEEKTPDGQVSRLRRIVSAAQVELTQPGSAEVTYDADRDVVVVTLFGKQLVRLGPHEWHMDDDEVKALVVGEMVDEYGDRR